LRSSSELGLSCRGALSSLLLSPRSLLLLYILRLALAGLALLGVSCPANSNWLSSDAGLSDACELADRPLLARPPAAPLCCPSLLGGLRLDRFFS